MEHILLLLVQIRCFSVWWEVLDYICPFSGPFSGSEMLIKSYDDVI